MECNSIRPGGPAHGIGTTNSTQNSAKGCKQCVGCDGYVGSRGVSSVWGVMVMWGLGVWGQGV